MTSAIHHKAHPARPAVTGVFRSIGQATSIFVLSAAASLLVPVFPALADTAPQGRVASPVISAKDFQVPGVVVDHSPKSAKTYLGSPGLVVLPDGSYVAKADEFGPAVTKGKPGVSRIYRSTDRGGTWKQIQRLEGLFWATIFVHDGGLYLMGTSEAYGNVVIQKSNDGGSSWTRPVNQDQGLLLDDARYHCAPTPVAIHHGRIWRAMEDAMAKPDQWGAHFQAFMMSAPVNSDLLKANSWTASNRSARDMKWLDGKFGGWLEGNAVVAPDGEMVDLLRVDYRGGGEKAAVIHIGDDGRSAAFDAARDIIEFPGGCKKFSVRFDPVTGRYWSLVNWVAPADAGGNPERTRNTVALTSSKDLRRWEIRCVVLHHPDAGTHGFQYLDWQFDGDDLIALSRTAYDDAEGGADSQHDSNFITFHRFARFRDLTPADSVVPPLQLGWKPAVPANGAVDLKSHLPAAGN